jgi:hypothetical protein
MKVYWTQRSIPELTHLEPSQRTAAVLACRFKPFRHWQTWAVFVGQFFIVLLAWLGGLVIDGGTWVLSGGSPPPIEKMHFPTMSVLLGSVAALGSVFLFGQVLTHMMRPHLKSYLEAHHAA